MLQRPTQIFEVDMERQIPPKMQKSVIYAAKTQKTAKKSPPILTENAKKRDIIKEKHAKIDLQSPTFSIFRAPSAPKKKKNFFLTK